MNPDLSKEPYNIDNQELLEAAAVLRSMSQGELLALRDLLKNQVSMADAAHLKLVYEGVS